MIFAVIDTNVIVAALLTRHEDAATVRVLTLMRNLMISPCRTRKIACFSKLL